MKTIKLVILLFSFSVQVSAQIKAPALSPLNRSIFLIKAREAFDKYGFDIPTENENKFIVGYEILMFKPLNDSTINSTIKGFIDNLSKLIDIANSSEIAIDEKNKRLFYSFVAFTKDGYLDDQELALLRINYGSYSTVGDVTSFKGLGFLLFSNILENTNQIPGMEEASNILKSRLESRHNDGKREACALLLAPGFKVMNEFIAETLVKKQK